MNDVVTVGIGSRTDSASAVAMTMGAITMFCTSAAARYYATALMLAADEVERINATRPDADSHDSGGGTVTKQGGRVG